MHRKWLGERILKVWVKQEGDYKLLQFVGLNLPCFHAEILVTYQIQWKCKLSHCNSRAEVMGSKPVEPWQSYLRLKLHLPLEGLVSLCAHMKLVANCRNQKHWPLAYLRLLLITTF